jgi:hypothetical protein
MLPRIQNKQNNYNNQLLNDDSLPRMCRQRDHPSKEIVYLKVINRDDRKETIQKLHKDGATSLNTRNKSNQIKEISVQRLLQNNQGQNRK